MKLHVDLSNLSTGTEKTIKDMLTLMGIPFDTNYVSKEKHHEFETLIYYHELYKTKYHEEPLWLIEDEYINSGRRGEDKEIVDWILKTYAILECREAKVSAREAYMDLYYNGSTQHGPEGYFASANHGKDTLPEMYFHIGGDITTLHVPTVKKVLEIR